MAKEQSEEYRLFEAITTGNEIKALEIIKELEKGSKELMAKSYPVVIQRSHADGFRDVKDHHAFNSSLDTLLHIAVEYGNNKIVKAMLELCSPEQVNTPNTMQDMIPLMRSKSVEISEMVIKFGGDVKYVSDNGHTIFSEACGSGNPLLVKHFLEKIDKSQINKKITIVPKYQFEYPLTRAISSGSLESVQLLIQNGADINATLLWDSDFHIKILGHAVRCVVNLKRESPEEVDKIKSAMKIVDELISQGVDLSEIKSLNYDSLQGLKSTEDWKDIQPKLLKSGLSYIDEELYTSLRAGVTADSLIAGGFLSFREEKANFYDIIVARLVKTDNASKLKSLFAFGSLNTEEGAKQFQNLSDKAEILLKGKQDSKEQQISSDSSADLKQEVDNSSTEISGDSLDADINS